MNMTIPEAIEVLRNFKLDMSQPDAFRMVRAIGMTEEALKKQLTLNEILEEIEEEQRSYEADHAWNYARGLEYAANIIRKHMNDSWIPVKERLPEVGAHVLGTNQYDEVLIYYYGWNSPHTKKMFFHLCGAAATIIAWQPLPNPYLEEREDA